MESSINCSADSLIVEFAAYDTAGIEVDDVAHPPGERRVGGDLHDRRNGIASRSAQPGGKQHQVRSCSHLRSHAFHVVARRALQIEPRALSHTPDSPVRR